MKKKRVASRLFVALSCSSFFCMQGNAFSAPSDTNTIKQSNVRYPEKSGKYYSIHLGAFAILENALAEQERLKNIDAIRIVKRGKLNLVVAGFFQTQEQAKNHLKALQPLVKNAYLYQTEYNPQNIQKYQFVKQTQTQKTTEQKNITDLAAKNKKILAEQISVSQNDQKQILAYQSQGQKNLVSPVPTTSPETAQNTPVTPPPRPQKEPMVTASPPPKPVVIDPYQQNLNAFRTAMQHYTQSPSALLLKRVLHFAEKISPDVTQRQNSAVALELAWVYWNNQQKESAQNWFQKALVWKPEQKEAHYGLALIDIDLKAWHTAYLHLKAFGIHKPEQQELAQLVLVAQAREAFDAQQFERARDQLKEAAQYRSLNPDQNILYIATLYALKQSVEGDQILARIEPDLRKKSAAPLALELAWVLLNQKRYPDAQKWFEQVTYWDTQHTEAYYGLGLALYQQNQLEAAKVTLLKADLTQEQTRELLSLVIYQQAKNAYDQQNYVLSLALVQNAQEYATPALKQDAISLEAWNELNLKNHTRAEKLFSQLYQEEKRPQYAEGLILSLKAQDKWAELEALPAQIDEPLQSEKQKAIGERYVQRKLFLAAAAKNPKKTTLHNVQQHEISAALQYREKSGTSGLSQLRIQTVPLIEGILAQDSTQQWRLSVSQVQLDSGTLGANAQIGSDLRTSYRFTPVTSQQGTEVTVHYLNQGWLTRYASFGLTPSNGVISPRLTFQAGLIQQQQTGHWQAELYQQPVRESMLSYVGLRDPYTGQTWGQVLKTGGRYEWQYAISPEWTVSTGINLARYTGQNVQSNQQIELNAALDRNLNLKGFDYFVVGPHLVAQHFNHNLSQFTLGHGGYFSPQRYVALGGHLDFQTEEQKEFVLHGRIALNWVSQTEDAASCFPLGHLPTSTQCLTGYDGNSKTGLGGSAQLFGVWRLSPQWQTGGGVVLRQSPSYRDYALQFFLRYFFEPRSYVLSPDLAEKQLGRLY